MFSRILVPTDFSASADAALALARSHFPDAVRCLLHVIDPQRLASRAMSSASAGDDHEAFEQSVAGKLAAMVRAGEEYAVRVGPAAHTILEKARTWDADLIVMGTHGRTGLALFLNGSVAEQIVRHARRPVLIEHERSAEAAAGAAPARP